MRQWLIPAVLISSALAGSATASAQKPLIDRPAGDKVEAKPVTPTPDPRPVLDDARRPSEFSNPRSADISSISRYSASSNSGRVWSEYARNVRHYNSALEYFRESNRDFRQSPNVQAMIEKLRSEFIIEDGSKAADVAQASQIPPSDTLPPGVEPDTIPPPRPPQPPAPTWPVEMNDYYLPGFRSLWSSFASLCNGFGRSAYGWYGPAMSSYSNWLMRYGGYGSLPRYLRYGSPYYGAGNVPFLGLYGMDYGLGYSCINTSYDGYYDYFYFNDIGISHTDACARVTVETFAEGAQEYLVALPSYSVRSVEMLDRVLESRRARREIIRLPIGETEEIEFAEGSVKRVDVKHCSAG